MDKAPLQATRETYVEESSGGKLWRKTKEAPFVPIGILGLIGAVGYGIVSYKNRGKMSTSVYVMKFRVIAQGMVVGAITLGVGFSVSQRLWQRYHTPAIKETDSSSS